MTLASVLERVGPSPVPQTPAGWLRRYRATIALFLVAFIVFLTLCILDV